MEQKVQESDARKATCTLLARFKISYTRQLIAIINNWETVMFIARNKRKRVANLPPIVQLLNYFNTFAFSIKHTHQTTCHMIFIFPGQKQVYIITLCSKIKGDLSIF